MKYTLSKTLYLACGEKPLHVHPREEKLCTDLWQKVQTLLSRDWIEKVGEDDSGEYYAATIEGRRIHLNNRIRWRRKNGKSTEQLERELEELK